MDIEFFSVAREDFSIRGACRVGLIDDSLDSDVLFDGNYNDTASPVELAIRKKGRLLDVIHGTSVGLQIVSPRFKACLVDEEVTGWSTYRTSFSGSVARELHGYVGLSITGRCGPLVEPSGGSGDMVFVQGIRPAPGRWDGSDMFAPEGTSFMCLTPRARLALESKGVTGLEFCDKASVEVPFAL